MGSLTLANLVEESTVMWGGRTMSYSLYPDIIVRITQGDTAHERH
jgi:hypothetical protein